MQATTCLYFQGTCESALQFYQACGLGKITQLRRYEGTPMEQRHGSAWRTKVLHAVFEGEGCACARPTAPTRSR